MNAKKVIYMLELLSRVTQGHEDELSRLYTDTLKEDEEIARLSEYLNTEKYIFYREGEFLRREAEELYNRLYDNPEQVLQTIDEISRVNEKIEYEIRCCREHMASPEPFTEAITILPQKEISSYRVAVRQTANVCAYLIAVYRGMEAIQSLIWSEGYGLKESIRVLNTSFIPALLAAAPPERGWVIYRRKLGGNALFGGCGFGICYYEKRVMEEICAGLQKLSMGEHAFWNPKAWAEGEVNVPCCWGVGNIVSVAPEEGLVLLQGGIITKPRVPDLVHGNLQSKIPEPMECLRSLTDGANFCVSPEDLVSVMDQWQIGNEVYRRRQKGECLFCGKALGGSRLVCRTHFTLER